MRTYFTILLSCFILFGMSACNQSGSGAATGGSKKSTQPLSVVEYDHLAKEYAENPDGDLKHDLSKKEIYSKEYKLQYQKEEAVFKFTAYDINRNADEAPAAILVKFDIDRLFTTLGAAPQRREMTKYFCIPSNGASESIHEKYNESVQELGFKDYEVYIKGVSDLLAEVHM